MTLTARFDSLLPGRERSFALSAPVDVLTAPTPAEVLPVLAAAERAVRDGRWVAGWVAYEAAAAFDAALPVKDLSGTELDGLPLAFFTVHERRRPAPPDPARPYRLGAWRPAISAETFADDVREIRERIGRGDCYQVNTTFRLRTDFEGDAAAFYRDLIRAQHGGYGAFIDAGRWVAVSASPELFFSWRHGRLVTRPMKGTSPRGRDLEEDRARRDALRCSEKDLAENTMIVDMVRNDLGRVARLGSVDVAGLWEAEKYDTVWQLTSTVTAEPRAGTDLVDVFGALFPAASITGAPKVSAMRVIAGRETGPRGVYCGAIGFGGPGPHGTPEWTFNVGIRTVLIDRGGGIARYGTGGGITYQSTADGEFAEAMLKTAVLKPRGVDAALLETMFWSPATGFRNLDRHLDRLRRGLEYFDVPGDSEHVVRELAAAVDGAETALQVRLLVGRDGAIRVESRAPQPSSDRPVRLAVDTVSIDRTDPAMAFKTTDRRVYEAAAARHPDADDVVMVNDRGEVTETTIANIGVLLDGRWYTPPLSSGCLPGTRRAALLAEGRLEERPITVEEMRGADGIVRFNAVRQWEPCECLGHVRTP